MDAFPPADESVMAPARAALERGDYGQCCALLQPLLEIHGVGTRLGAQLRLLLATAQMGQGDSVAAAATCRSLRACRDATLRAQAKDLQEVLEAPALSRPREWSLTLPSLGELQPLEGEFKAMARRRSRRTPAPPPPPPTGATRAPLGFALVALALLLIAVLLVGCVDLNTSLRFPAPGRLQLEQTSRSLTGGPLPWQRQLALSLRHSPLRIQQDHAVLRLRSPSLPSAQALQLLSTTVQQGTALAGLSLPEPQWQLQERNWLLGVQQQLSLSLDLRSLQPLPGLSLSLELEPLPQRAVRQAEPLPVQAHPGSGGRPARVHWALQPGALNRFEMRCWRWSRLGLGALAIALLLALVAGLRRLKLAAGFGLPQLPA